MTDWKQVAETLTTKARVYQAFDVGHVRDAIRLCEQAASLPDSEAVLRLAAKLPRARRSECWRPRQRNRSTAT
jgi:hypothetical protein